MGDQQLAVVTGASRGIGAAIARAFHEDGFRVVDLDLIEPAEELPGALRYIHADITDAESVQQAFAKLDRIDVLVNNAGIQRIGMVGSQPQEQWDAVIATNLTGAFRCTSAALPLLKVNGGAIVSIASAAAFVGLPGRAAYSAAKAGLIGFNRTLAVEVAPLGIRANVVAPGFTATGLVNQALADGSLDEAWMLDRVPSQRLARPEEIAAAVLFLAGPAASYITGQTLLVDGGWTAQGIGRAPDWLTGQQNPG